MVRSESVIINAGVVGAKVAEIDVYFFRLPFATDEELKQGTIDTCNQAFIDEGRGDISTTNPRLKKIGVFNWISTVDVIETATVQPYGPPVQGLLDPLTWSFILIAIAGMLFGYLITKWIIYRVTVRPLLEALEEVVKSLDEIIEAKHNALAAGYITQEYSDALDAELEEARDEADEAGDDPQYDWVDYLAQFAQYLPLLIKGVVAVAILGTIKAFAPRR